MIFFGNLSRILGLASRQLVGSAVLYSMHMAGEVFWRVLHTCVFFVGSRERGSQCSWLYSAGHGVSNSGMSVMHPL